MNREKILPGLKRLWQMPLFLVPACLPALACLLWPTARNGFLALLNRIFEMSEAVNRYRYDRFAVSGEGMNWALLLCIFTLLLLTVRAMSCRGLALCLFAGLCLTEAYLGLSLPPAVHILLLFALARPFIEGGLCRALLLAGAAALIAVLFLGGTNPGTEALSERVRDRISARVGTAGAGREEGASLPVHEMVPVSLEAGEGGASGQGYEHILQQEKEISRPEWTYFVRTLALLLLTAALLSVPFLPFLFLNRQAKRAKELRQLFEDGDAGTACAAMFRHACLYLECCGLGGGNRLYRSWWQAWDGRLPGAYIARFRECEGWFEQAAYGKDCGEWMRSEMRAFLAETEHLCYDEATLKKRFRLKYVECLHL